MTKKLFLITFIFLSVKLFAETPILSNFRVEDSQKNLVFFDSSTPITASSVAGFTISGKTISGVTINTGQLSGHYFIVSSPLTFWDNNTIRYEGGSDFKDLSSSDPISDFTLTYINNNISEPIASTNRYVTTFATGSGDGSSEANSWTITQATRASNLSNGMTIWIKSGNYGNANFKLSSFHPATVVKYIGYKSTIGDITTNIVDTFTSYSQKSTIIDNSTFPVFTGVNVNGTIGVSIYDSSNIIIKNIQVQNYQDGFRVSRRSLTQHSYNVHFENCTAKDSWTETSPGKYELNSGFGFAVDWMNDVTYSAVNMRFINNLSVDTAHGGFILDGVRGLVMGNKSYSGIVGSDAANDFRAQDYYFVITRSGDNNIIRNNKAFRINNDNHGGHAYGTKGDYYNKDGDPTTIIKYNLFDSNYSNYIGEIFWVAWENAHHNVFKNNVSENAPGGSVANMVARDGAHDNIFEMNRCEGGQQGITRWASGEFKFQYTNPTYFSKNNTFRNNVITGVDYGIMYLNLSGGGSLATENDKIYNNTIITKSSIFYYITTQGVSSNDAITNNIFYSTNGSNSLYAINALTSSAVQTYNDYYKVGGTYTLPVGAGNMKADPQFVNVAGGDYHLNSDNLVDKGTTITSVSTDFDGNARPDGDTHDIGAFEKKNNQLITANAGLDVTICNNPDGSANTTTLTASGGASYSWNTGETTASIDVSPTATTTYTVTVSDGVNSDSDDVIVTVNEAPTVDAGSDVSLCSGESVILTATGIGNFLWNTGETTASITVNPTSTTTYTVTANNSCSTDATDDIIVTVNPAITLDAGSDVTICLGENITLTATGNSNFLWSTGATTASITVNPATTTTYSVTSDNGNCSKTDDVVVTVNELPSVDLGSDQSICYGETVTLTATGIGTFLWNTGETTASITVNPVTTTTYTVTASNSCTTDVTDDIIVNVNPEIGLTVGNDISICVGESTTLTAIGNGDFLWNTGETTSSITVQPNSTTTYSVSSSIGACTENESILVTVDAAPSVDLGPDQSICFGETVTLTATGIGNFLWNTGETTASIIVNPTATTTYTVTASNSCSTDATDDIIVNVNPEIGLTVGNDISICEGESTILTATGNGDFLWNTGETTSSITVQPNSTTTYSVSSSIGACTENASILVTVDVAPSVDLGSDQSICYGETVTLTANGLGNFLWNTGETTASITVNPTTTTTYTVIASNACSDNVSDDIIINVNPEIGLTVGNDISICTGESTTLTATGNGDFLWSTGESTSSITVQPNSTTTYTVSSNLGSCTENASVIVTVSDSSSVNLGPDKAICFGESVTLTAAGSGNFLWSTGETTSSITVNPTTTTTYNVTASNSCTGEATDDIIVNVNELPSVNAGADTTITNGESTTLTATGSGNFLWSTGETSPSITVNPTSSTTYSVVITSDQGCLNQDTVLVTVENAESIIADAGVDQTVCPDSSDTVLTASGGESYLWSTGETTASISVSPTITTVYTVAVYVGNTHTLDEVTVFIDENCLESNSSEQQELKIYPNPTNGIVNIELSGFKGDLNVSLYNLNGSMIHSKNMNNSAKAKVLKSQLNLSMLAKGMYIVRLNNGNTVVTKKLMVI